MYECADTNLTCEEAIYKRYNIGKTTQLIPRIRVKVKNDDEGGEDDTELYNTKS